MKTLDYERYLFRLTKQDEEESLESFVERLRHQAKKCEFTDPDSQTKDQIIEKCASNELRKSAFENQMTLSQLILTGKTLENAEKNTQAESLKIVKEKEREKKQECIRCGRYDHLFYDRRCPALKNKCQKCLKFGHYMLMCNTKPRQNADRSIINKRNCESQSGSTGENVVKRLKCDDEQTMEPENADQAECTRCGFKDHFYYDSCCPAKKVKCELCFKFGHYARKCRGLKDPERKGIRNKTTDDNQRNLQNQEQLPSVKVAIDPSKQAGDIYTVEDKTISVKIDDISEMVESVSAKPPTLPDTRVKPDILATTNQAYLQFIKRSNSKIYAGTVGGMPVKIIVGEKNIMSKAQFRKLREGKFNFLTAEKGFFKFDNMEFIATFTAKVKINELCHLVTFFVEDGNNDIVSVNPLTAQKLNLTKE